MRKFCAKMVPKIFSEYQRQRRFTVCQDITKRLEAEPDFLNSVIAGNETWVFEYDPKTKRQSRERKSYGSPRPMKARKSKSKVKVMLIVFFDIQGIVHFKFLHQGQTVNQTLYKEIIMRTKPDLAICDFFLFPKIKSVLKGTHFSDIDSIKKDATTEIKKIPENAFQECFESWKKRMHKCLRVEGDYFEGL